MDTDAYLRRQGWRGAGHSLDHRGHGIKKPLLIAHKQDQLGLGQKKAAHRVDDQWWMRAFDESLQNIGTGQESTLSQVRKQGINRGGLYGFFVKGEGLVGTISNTEESSAAGTPDTSASLSRTSTPPTSSDSPSDDSASSEGETASKHICSSTTMTGGSSTKDSRKRKRLEEAGVNNAKRHRAQQVDNEAKAFKSIKRQAKRAIQKREENGEFEAALSKKDKDAKLKRTASIRAATRELEKELIVDAMMKGDLPNPKNNTREETLARFEEDQQEREDAEQLEKGLKRVSKKVARDMRAMEQAAKRKGREERRQEKRKQDAVNGTASDESARKYASTSEKKERKRAAEAGLSVEAYRLNLEIAEHQLAIAAKLAKLSAEEKSAYEKRADLKGISLEHYVLRRIQKKDSQQVLFITDLEGDASLLTKVQSDRTESEKPSYQLNEDGSIPLDPSVWEGREIPSLSKAERKARREYLAERRLVKKARKRGISVEKLRKNLGLETSESKGAKYNVRRETLVDKMLKDQGISKGESTKTQRSKARVEAGRILRREKKEGKRQKKEGKRQKKEERGSKGSRRR